VASGESPLYARICRAVASDPDLLALVADVPASQPVPNLLLAAVHDLLLAGAEHPLADHYPSVGGTAGAEGADLAFRDFALTHAATVSELAATRRVQTNEVRRCIAWLPALASLREPLALIEIGASAGLNLNVDRYRYRYSGRHGATEIGDGALVLETEVRGDPPPLPHRPPTIAWRCGIDLDPIDVQDEDAVRWARALLWPEQAERSRRFEHAVQIARRHPVSVVAGDALDVLPDVVADAPDEAGLVVFHSFVVNQLDAAGRESLVGLLDRLGRDRPIHRLSLEWLDADQEPMLDEIVHGAGRNERRRLGAVHHHGEWIRWR
jgi:hypothetical protein